MKLLWLRIGAEGFVIVVSILFAFALDAWWDELGERRAETVMLRSIHAELTDNLGQLRQTQERHRIRHEAASQLLQVVAYPHTEQPLDSVRTWLAWLPRGALFDPALGNLDAVFSAGDLDVVESETLRGKIAGWPAAAENYVEVEEIAMKLILDDLWPFLRDRVAFPRAGLFAREPPSRFDDGLTALLNDRAFENLLIELIYWERSTIIDGDALETKTVELLAAMSDRIR